MENEKQEARELQDLGPCLVEIMGHRTSAGTVREVVLFGAPMCRIDVPSDPPTTTFYGASAIFSVTPTTEEVVAKHVAATAWRPPVRFLPTGEADGGDPWDDGDEAIDYDEDPAEDDPAGEVA